MSAEKMQTDGPVAAYKTLLRDLIDRRPSGTRQRIADALGKNKSFVSQITNPAYTVPVPAKHLATIFELCHVSPDERWAFMDAYLRAHPGRTHESIVLDEGASVTLTIDIPNLKEPRRQRELIESIRMFADHAITLAQSWDDTAPNRAKGRNRYEKTNQRRR